MQALTSLCDLRHWVSMRTNVPNRRPSNTLLNTRGDSVTMPQVTYAAYDLTIRGGKRQTQRNHSE